MADALISKEHFYLNGSVYNNSDTDKDAVIQIEDTNDILQSNDDWLVHVTRFSCDAMKSLTYVEKDDSATWTIRVADNLGAVKQTYVFVVDQDFATPQALVAAMNCEGRFIKLQGSSYTAYEVFRWQIEAEGRFRLITMPVEAINNWHIQYTGSASMNALLGFETITPFLHFSRTNTETYAEVCDYIHAQAILADQSRFHSQMNYTLRHFVNGLLCRHTNIQDDAEWTGDGTFQTAGWEATVDFLILRVQENGTVPTRAKADNEALLPKAGSAMICEYFEIGTATEDPGFKVRNSTLIWHRDYGQGSHYGRVAFSTINAAGATGLPCCNFPHYKPWLWQREGTEDPAVSHFQEYTELYPLDSLFGYIFSAVGTVFPYSPLMINAVVNERSVELTQDLPFYVVAGADLHIPEDVFLRTNNASPVAKGYSTHQIESIAADRRTITFDFPIGPLRNNAALTTKHVLVTNRRIPFQSRSVNVGWPLMAWRHDITYGSVVSEGYSVLFPLCNSISVGDWVTYYHDGVGLPFSGANNYEVSHIDFDPQGSEAQGAFPASYFSIRHYGIAPLSDYDLTDASVRARITIFCHKRVGDHLRWGVDKENLKLASTTFSYHKHQYASGIPEAIQVSNNGYEFPLRYSQTFDDALLRKMIDKTHDDTRMHSIFDAQSTAQGSGKVVEKILASVVQAIPPDPKISTNGRFMEFGWSLNASATKFLTPYSSVQGYTDDWTTPWYGLRSLTSYGSAAADDKVNPFVETNQYDKPLYQKVLHPDLPSQENFPTHVAFYQEDSAGSATIDGNGHIVRNGVGYRPVSPIICGVRRTLEEQQTTKGFVMWAPRQIGAGSERMYQPIHTGDLAKWAQWGFLSQVSITFSDISRAYHLCKKEISPNVGTKAVRLYGFDGDYLTSMLASQIDLVFPFKHMVLTSDDLNQKPERTSNIGGIDPILSSYTLASAWPTSVDSQGQPAGGASAKRLLLRVRCQALPPLDQSARRAPALQNTGIPVVQGQ